MTQPLGRADVELLRSMISERLGLEFGPDRLDELAAVLQVRMEAHGCTSAVAYARELASHDELRALADVLTIGETYFMRYADHFRALREHVLPDRLDVRRATRKLRILSAGCSSGEEAYSVAVTLRELVPDLASWQIEILGVDVNPSAIARARAGRYSQWSLRQTTEEFSRRWFQKLDGDYVLDAEVRAMVTFEERNLILDDPSFFRAGSFDLVLCRNVTMYFAPEVTRRVVARIAQSLDAGGYLFLGHAETLRGLSNEFHLRHTHDTFYYQLREARTSRGDDATGSIHGPPQRSEVDALDAPPAVDSTSWIETIRRASERIQTLGTQPPAAATSAGPAVPTRNVTARALELIGQERFADALDALGPHPGDSDAELLRAVLLANSGRMTEAERVCGHLLGRDELNASAHYVTALCREHEGDLASAIEHDQAAAYLDPTFAMPRLHLGLLAKKTADHEGAIREFEIALVLLEREDASRVLMLGGGFSRETLVVLCRSELRALGARG